MSFETKGFLREKFSARTAAVKVPELSQWFAEGAAPVWIVKGLSAPGLSRVREAVGKDKVILNLVEILASATGSEIQGPLKTLLNLDEDNLPEDYVKRLELLILGSVDPACDRDLAKKIAEVYPSIFTRLTEKILELSGLGAVPGKPQDSGKIPASATP